MSSDQHGRWLSRVALEAPLSRVSRLFSHQSELLAAGQHRLPITPASARIVSMPRTREPAPRSAVDCVAVAEREAALVMEGLHKSAIELSQQVIDLERRLEAERRMAHPNGIRGFHLFAMASAFVLFAAAAAFLTDQLAAGSSLVPPSVATVGLICGVWLAVATGAVIWANPRADG